MKEEWPDLKGWKLVLKNSLPGAAGEERSRVYAWAGMRIQKDRKEADFCMKEEQILWAFQKATKMSNMEEEG